MIYGGTLYSSASFFLRFLRASCNLSSLSENGIFDFFCKPVDKLDSCVPVLPVGVKGKKIFFVIG